MLNIIYRIYSNTNLKLEFNKDICNAFKANIGVKQGCCLSTLLFSIIIDDLGSKLKNIQLGIYL